MKKYFFTLFIILGAMVLIPMDKPKCEPLPRQVITKAHPFMLM
jgi:hypothetical protein